ncbi:DNA-binding protein inhibitor ID-2b [Antennarius striatus]|uniref:DNA-binding protein inhibitor ID-2b n=1 Tax=Antennarius striatus TaxID=241820 RepID=UPI0035B1C45D
MTAGSAGLSAGRRRSSSRRSRHPLLLRDMNVCYRVLRGLVPGLPPGRPASRVEILQHVIDYIRDLQTALDATCPATEGPEPRDPHPHLPGV